MDERAEPGMDEIQREGEVRRVDLAVRDRQIPRGQPSRQRRPQPADVDEVAVALEDQRALRGANSQHHADAATDVLLEARRPSEALGRMDDLWETAAARIE